MDVDRLDDVTRRLGEAVLDPGRWTVLMEDICAAAHARGATLLQSDIRTADVPVTPSIREFLAGYFANDLHITDVRARRGVPLLLSGRPVVRDQDIFSSEREMLRDPLYAHAAEWGLSWFAVIGFHVGSALWGLSIQRSTQDGPFETPEVKALE